MHKPIDSVRVVLFDGWNINRFGILTEQDDVDTWKLPGGRLWPGEDPADAAMRETAEELQTIGRWTLAKVLPNDDGISKRFIYTGIVTPALVIPSPEVAELEWV